jgi:hypothetical protein
MNYIPYTVFLQSNQRGWEAGNWGDRGIHCTVAKWQFESRLTRQYPVPLLTELSRVGQNVITMGLEDKQDCFRFSLLPSETSVSSWLNCPAFQSEKHEILCGVELNRREDNYLFTYKSIIIHLKRLEWNTILLAEYRTSDVSLINPNFPKSY